MADVEFLLDHLGVGEFLTIGGSGGGPHSIACAALMPDRCLAAAALVTVAPWQAAGLDFFATMDQSNIDEFNAALAGEDTLREWMKVGRRGVPGHDPGDDARGDG